MFLSTSCLKSFEGTLSFIAGVPHLRAVDHDWSRPVRDLGPQAGGELEGNVLESSRNQSPNLVYGKIVFHETGPWCQKHWVPSLYRINSKPLLFTYKTENLNFCSFLTHTLVSSQRQSVALGPHSIRPPTPTQGCAFAHAIPSTWKILSHPLSLANFSSSVRT